MACAADRTDKDICHAIDKVGDDHDDQSCDTGFHHSGIGIVDADQRIAQHIHKGSKSSRDDADIEQADPDNPVHAVIFSGADILAGEGLA